MRRKVSYLLTFTNNGQGGFCNWMEMRRGEMQGGRQKLRTRRCNAAVCLCSYNIYERIMDNCEGIFLEMKNACRKRACGLGVRGFCLY